MTAPRVISAMREMLITRGWLGLNLVVNWPTTSLIPSDSAQATPLASGSSVGRT